MRRAAVLAVLLAASVLARPARAASERTLGLDALIDAADAIVVGEVIGSESHFEGRLIITRSTVQVSEALKGTPETRLDVTQLGGTAVHPVIGVPVTMDASTFVALRPGEKVVLFVEPRPAGGHQLVGAEQGKLVIRDEPATGDRTLPVGPKRLRVYPERTRDVVSPDVTTLEDLRARIRRHLDGSKGATVR
jgi:hypothetical protein